MLDPLFVGPAPKLSQCCDLKHHLADAHKDGARDEGDHVEPDERDDGASQYHA